MIYLNKFLFKQQFTVNYLSRTIYSSKFDLSIKPPKMAKSKYEYVRENEDFTDKQLLNDCYTVIRIDGSRFHQFSTLHNYVKPNDKRALDLMNEAALYVMKTYFPNIILAYGQSDEFSFVLSRKSGLFNRRTFKLNSMIVSAFSSAFVFNWSKYFNCTIDRTNQKCAKENVKIINEFTDDKSKFQQNNQSKNEFKEFIELKYPPIFDSRCVLYTSDNEIKDYLKWRQVDCHINNLYNTTFYALMGKYARWYLNENTNKYEAEIVNLDSQLTPLESETKLRGTVSKQKRENILKEMFGIDYELEMEQFRRGSLIVFDKIDDKMYKEYQQCLISKKKKLLDKFNLDDFIHFQILHQELIQSDYLDHYLSKFDIDQ